MRKKKSDIFLYDYSFKLSNNVSKELSSKSNFGIVSGFVFVRLSI